MWIASSPDQFFALSPFVLDTPAYIGSHQAAVGCQLHGNLTPGRISVGCSHCLRRLTLGYALLARTVTEQEYRPIAGYGRTRSRLVPIVICFTLLAFSQILAQLLCGSCSRNSNGKVPDEWVCCFQSANPFIDTRGRTGERPSVTSHLFPHSNIKSVVQNKIVYKISFNFSMARSTLNLTARFVHPSISAICS